MEPTPMILEMGRADLRVFASVGTGLAIVGS